jgi:hypothetical protein
MKKYINLKYIIIAVLLSVIPASASAATVYLEASRNTMSVGDTAIVAVKINADGAVLNTVEGDIALKSTSLNLVVQEFSLANSSFGLWPRTPSLSNDARTVSFVGGVPGGFSIEGATLFKMVVEAKKEGPMTISPQNFSVYINDGKGTKVPVQTKDITINVVAKKNSVATQNDWGALVSQDKTPPEDFIIVLGQDPNLFSGKKFAYFSSIDNQTGIDHYDVSENGAPAVRSGSTYVFQDQSENVKLDVTAYDKAGNKKTAVLVPEAVIPWLPIVIIIILIVIIYFTFKKSKRSKTNVSPTV